jgi:ATP adenylyltransferase
MSTPIWAPWRMEYIRGTHRSACVFCDLGAAAPDAMREKLVLVVQPHALVCLNKYPFTTSHLLVAPRRHVADLGELTDEEHVAHATLLRDTVVRLRRALGAEGINVGYNLGKAAGAGIADHLHAHVVPRWSGDTNFMPVVADIRVMPQYLDEAWAHLYPSFADLPGVRAPAPASTGGPARSP